MQFNLLSENKLKISLSEKDMESLGFPTDISNGILGEDVLHHAAFRNLFEDVRRKTSFDTSCEFEVKIYTSSSDGADIYLTKTKSEETHCPLCDYSKKTYLFSFTRFSHLLGACKYISSLDICADTSVYYEKARGKCRYYLLFSQSIYELCGDIYPSRVIGEFAECEIRHKPSVAAYIAERCTPLIEKDAAIKLAEFY